MTAEDVVESTQEEQTASEEEVRESVSEEPRACEEAATEESSPVQVSGDEGSVQGEESAPSEVVEAQASEQSSTPQSGEVSSEGQQGPQLTQDQRIGLLEALLLASGDPLPINRVEELLGCSKADVLALAEALKEIYAAECRGLEVVNVASKLQLRTKAVYAEYVRNLIAVKPRKLSQAALETLAVIAYQQPVVKSEVDKIRGVDVAPTIKTLLERKLVKILGYQATVGQPALYGTTEDFLSIFGLTSLAELPSLRDLKALAKEPGEAAEGTEDLEGEGEEGAGEDTDSEAPVEASEAEAATAVQ
jgi:segregation and condensation protein B